MTARSFLSRIKNSLALGTLLVVAHGSCTSAKPSRGASSTNVRTKQVGTLHVTPPSKVIAKPIALSALDCPKQNVRLEKLKSPLDKECVTGTVTVLFNKAAALYSLKGLRRIDGNLEISANPEVDRDFKRLYPTSSGLIRNSCYSRCTLILCFLTAFFRWRAVIRLINSLMSTQIQPKSA